MLSQSSDTLAPSLGCQVSEFFDYIDKCPAPEVHHQRLLLLSKRLFREGWQFTDNRFTKETSVGSFSIKLPLREWGEEHLSKIQLTRRWQQQDGNLRVPRIATRTVDFAGVHQVSTSTENLLELLRD